MPFFSLKLKNPKKIKAGDIAFDALEDFKGINLLNLSKSVKTGKHIDYSFVFSTKETLKNQALLNKKIILGPEDTLLFLKAIKKNSNLKKLLSPVTYLFKKKLLKFSTVTKTAKLGALGYVGLYIRNEVNEYIKENTGCFSGDKNENESLCKIEKFSCKYPEIGKNIPCEQVPSKGTCIEGKSNLNCLNCSCSSSLQTGYKCRNNEVLKCRVPTLSEAILQVSTRAAKNALSTIYTLTKFFWYAAAALILSVFLFFVIIFTKVK